MNSVVIQYHRFTTEIAEEHRLGETRFVVVTDPSGANRAYEVGDTVSESLAGDDVTDTEGNRWTVTADALITESGNCSVPRIPTHRAFLFGWYSYRNYSPVTGLVTPHQPKRNSR